MIASLHGTVTFIHPPIKRGNFLELQVGGVGYRVEITGKLARLVKVGQAITLHTYLEVREDAQELFGFLNRDEMQMFRMLLSVQRVGPRSALHVLESVSPHDLRQAVAAGSAERLVHTAGLGQRLAEGIVAGLRGKLAELVGSGAMPQDTATTEAREALVALGFPAHEAQTTIAKVKKDGMVSDDIIRAALKVLGQSASK